MIWLSILCGIRHLPEPFPAEAGFLGKPVIIGSYFKEIADQLYSPESMPPYIFVYPDEMEATVEKYVLDYDLRCEKWQKGFKNYLRRYSNIECIAQKYFDIIIGNISEELWLIPEQINYTLGYGAPDMHIKKINKRPSRTQWIRCSPIK